MQNEEERHGQEQRQAKATKREQDEVPPRQPAWREQAPAKPRKRVKRKPIDCAIVPRQGRGRRARPERRPLVMPSRETWVLVVPGLRAAAGRCRGVRWA